jgi:hypothetical protein
VVTTELLTKLLKWGANQAPEMLLCTITPEEAEHLLLTYNTHNRKASMQRVFLYAEDMHEGCWRLTHQAIAFAVNGNGRLFLQDGGQRLKAVIVSGVAVPFWVCIGIDQESQQVVDRGRTRSDIDTAKLAGIECEDYIMTVVNNIERGLGSWSGPLSWDQKVRLMEKHAAALRYVSEVFKRRVEPGITIMPTRVIVAKAYYWLDKYEYLYHSKAECRGRLAQFVDHLIDYPGQDEWSGKMVETLRQSLRDSRVSMRSRMGLEKKLQAVMSVCDWWMRKVERKKTAMELSVDIYPIRDEDNEK